MAITVGLQAPEFTLVSDQKETVNLSDYRGKNVVVLFFPLAYTGVCTKELCTMRDDIANYNNICLLYTSPSPRDQRGSRMPSSA